MQNAAMPFGCASLQVFDTVSQVLYNAMVGPVILLGIKVLYAMNERPEPILEIGSRMVPDVARVSGAFPFNERDDFFAFPI